MTILYPSCPIFKNTTAANNNNNLNRRYVELPSLEEIEEMDKQRSKAIESLEISDDGGMLNVKAAVTYSL